MDTKVINTSAIAVVLIVSISKLGMNLAAQAVNFQRGDSNADGALNLTDPVFTLNALFRAGPQPECEDAADANDDGELNLSDGVYTLNHLFLGGPGPAAPFADCGSDTTPDSLDCVSFPACSQPQAGVKVAWVARYNGPADGEDSPRYLTVDGAGNVYVTGRSAGTQPEDKYGWATVKYDPDGQELWVARYDEQQTWLQPDDAHWMGIDSEGNVLVTGSSSPRNAGWTHSTTIKYDPEGRELWLAHYAPPGGASFEATAGAVDTAGQVYVTGPSDGKVTVKYAPDGRELWVAPFGGVSIAVDAAGNVHVTGGGGTVKYAPDGRELWVAPLGGVRMALDAAGNVHLTAAAGARTKVDYETVKYDSSGRELWVARYDGPAKDRDVPSGVVVDAAGNVYVTGESRGIGTLSDYATVKYAPDGHELWVARYDGPGNDKDVAADIALDAAGNVYITGISNGGATGPDFATIKYDPEGHELWTARFDGPREPPPGIDDERFDSGVPLRLVVDAAGNVFVAGSSWGGPGGYDYVTIKYVPVGGQ